MLKEFRKVLENKVRELGNNFDPTMVWEKEMMIIEETEWEYFPEFRCVYYAESQSEGMMEFGIRFSLENQYLNCIDLEADINIIL